MVGADVTVVTRLGATDLLQAELVALVARRALAYGPVLGGAADVVTRAAREAGDLGAFHFEERVARHVRPKPSLGYRLVLLEVLGGQAFCAVVGDVGRERVAALIELSDLCLASALESVAKLQESLLDEHRMRQERFESIEDIV